MKSQAVLSVLIAALGVTASPMSPPPGSARFFERDVEAVNGEAIHQGTKDMGEFKLQQVKIRYGPYNIPANEALEPQTASTIGIGRERGGLTNVPTSNIQKPCSDCLVTSMRAGLENEDGEDLNVDTGVMLHHMVVMGMLYLPKSRQIVKRSLTY
jgi:hypothetical protein